MANKYTATFSCDRELWNAFKSWSKQRNSSASQEISNFMLSCISSKENVSNLYQEKENLESLLRKLVIEELNLRSDIISNTEDTDNTDGSCNTDNTDDTGITPIIGGTGNTENTDNSKIDTLVATSGDSQSDNNPHNNQYSRGVIAPEVLLKYRDKEFDELNTDSTDDTDHISEVNSDQLFTDKELKDRENLTQNKSTITRWRQGRGKIPERITQNYQIVGSRWKYLGK